MKKFFAIWMILLLCGCSAQPPVYRDTYNREAAVAYSYEYTTARNPDYADFQANCTNYISQCLVAGGMSMDEPIAPREGQRITYHDNGRWFSAFIHTDPTHWREFSVSTAFCRTEDFVEYWTQTRGMTLTGYRNDMSGLIALHGAAEVGDVLILYAPDGTIAHLCLIASTADNKLLVNANTVDHLDYNVLSLSSTQYPTVGLLKIT